MLSINNDENKNQEISPFRNNILKDRIALITGGSSGIGFGIAQQLVLHGAKVLLMGRRLQYLIKAVDQLNKLVSDESNQTKNTYYQGDVRSHEDCRQAIEKISQYYHTNKLHILVCSHAGNFLAAAENLSLNGFKTVMNIDSVGVFNICHQAFHMLKQSEQSIIINISATLHLASTQQQIHASAAKAAIDSMTRSMALEQGEFGIRVNGIAPGPIKDTPGLMKLSGGATQNYLQKLAERIPLKRLGTKFDIGMLVIFLCSSAGSYITGTTIVVDGGEQFSKGLPFISRDQVTKISKSIEKRSRATKTLSKI